MIYTLKPLHWSAVNFRARLRFPRADDEPPRRLRSNQQLEAFKHMKPTFSISIKNRTSWFHIQELNSFGPFFY